jgi:sugar-specific transcriptional regulator TrmB
VSANFAADFDAVRTYVVKAVESGQSQLAQSIVKNFGVSRPTAYNYLHALADEGMIERTGRGKYELKEHEYEIHRNVDGLAEHEVWESEIQPGLSDLPGNVQDIWYYGCTEMINNVIDHSESEAVSITVTRKGQRTSIDIYDRGVGIFRKISKALALEDDRHAVLELSKGKVTTDPDNHTGEGIFFSSRVFDKYSILSGDVYFAHDSHDPRDYILGEETPAHDINGTMVKMTLSDLSGKDIGKVFDEYATDTEDYRFDRTVVPVKLLQYGDDRLVSRSQAKRLLTRFERFKTVILDFDGVEAVGQAFADEVFRVFVSRHPDVEIVPTNTNEKVSRMIHRAIGNRSPQRSLLIEQH